MRTFLRRLDRARRYATLPLLQLILRRERSVAFPLDPASTKRVLVIRDDGLGDAITTLPMIRLLQRLLPPSASIDVLCSHRNAQVFAALPDVSRLWLRPDSSADLLRLLRRLRREQYDVILLTVRNKTTASALLMRAIAARHTIRAASYRGPEYDLHFDFHSRLASEATNEWQATLNLAAELFGYTLTDLDTQPFFPRVERSWHIAAHHCNELGLELGAYVVINLSAYQPRNSWNRAQLHTTLAALRSEGVHLIACGIEPDITRYRDILDSLTIPSYPPTHDIHQIAGLIANARCIITPDTGTVHLATALGTPLVALYRSDGKSEHYWAPFCHPNAVQLIAELGTLPGSIPAEKIIHATLELIHSRATAPALS